MSRKPAIHRIVVALDMSPHSLAALAAAADLAAGLDAEIVGVFVEDVNWLRHGELPAAHVVSRYSGEKVKIRCDDVRRRMAAQAQAAAAALAQMAEARHVRWSFSVARGAPPETLQAAAVGADVVSLGRAGWPAPGRRTVGSVTHRLVMEGPASALVMSAGQHLGPPVVLWADDTGSAVRAGYLAAAVAACLDWPIEVLISGASSAAAARTEHDLRVALGSGVPAITFQHTPPSSAVDIIGRLRALRPGVLVAPQALVNEAGDGLIDLLDRLRCPVLVTR